MKTTILLALALVSFNATANEWLNKTVPKLTLKDGKEFQTVTFTAIGETSISIKHSVGIATIQAEELTAESQAALGFNANKLAAARSTAAEKAKAQAEEAAQPKYFPGLAAVDLHGNLTDKGFALEKLLGGEYGSSWTCTAEDPSFSMSADAWGDGPLEIRSVRATIRQKGQAPIIGPAAEFLGYVASLPYDGADPIKARSWVESNVHRAAATVIGGVKFEIIAPTAFVRMLRMTPQ